MTDPQRLGASATRTVGPGVGAGAEHRMPPGPDPRWQARAAAAMPRSGAEAIERLADAVERLTPWIRRAAFIFTALSVAAAVAALAMVTAVVAAADGVGDLWGWLLVLIATAVLLIPSAILWLVRGSVRSLATLPGQLRVRAQVVTPEVMAILRRDAADLEAVASELRGRTWRPLGRRGWKVLREVAGGLADLGLARRLLVARFLVVGAVAGLVAVGMVLVAPMVVTTALLLD